MAGIVACLIYLASQRVHQTITLETERLGMDYTYVITDDCGQIVWTGTDPAEAERVADESGHRLSRN